MNARSTPRQAILAYYVATAIFLVLDAGLGINVRIAFLEPFPGWRAAYYGVCFVCLGLMLWQPSWTVIVSAFESLVTLVALILSMGIRALTLTDTMFGAEAQVISVAEIVNFLLSGSIAYLAWTRGMQALFGR